jgi:hypothetical protein
MHNKHNKNNLKEKNKEGGGVLIEFHLLIKV